MKIKILVFLLVSIYLCPSYTFGNELTESTENTFLEQMQSEIKSLKDQIENLEKQIQDLQSKSIYNYLQITNDSKPHGLDVYHGAKGTGNVGLNLACQNSDESCAWVSGQAEKRGELKVSHTKPLQKNDKDAAAISIELKNSKEDKTKAQGLFFNMGSSQNYLMQAVDVLGQFLTVQRGKLMFNGSIQLQNNNNICMKDDKGKNVCIDAKNLQKLIQLSKTKIK